jgi:hypothetical protein
LQIAVDIARDHPHAALECAERKEVPQQGGRGPIKDRSVSKTRCLDKMDRENEF